MSIDDEALWRCLTHPRDDDVITDAIQTGLGGQSYPKEHTQFAIQVRIAAITSLLESIRLSSESHQDEMSRLGMLPASMRYGIKLMDVVIGQPELFLSNHRVSFFTSMRKHDILAAAQHALQASTFLQ